MLGIYLHLFVLFRQKGTNTISHPVNQFPSTYISMSNAKRDISILGGKYLKEKH